MNIVPIIINSLSLVFCLGTAGSIVIHDTNFDKAMVTAVTSRTQTVDAPTYKLGNDPHTHSDRGSLYQAIRDIHTSQPRIQPRNQEEKSYIKGKLSARGHHPFDNYTLPIIS